VGDAVVDPPAVADNLQSGEGQTPVAPMSAHHSAYESCSHHSLQSPIGPHDRCCVGASVGAAVGTSVGTSVGIAEGASVGIPVGASVGADVGAVVGAAVDAPVGASVVTAGGVVEAGEPRPCLIALISG